MSVSDETLAELRKAMVKAGTNAKLLRMNKHCSNLAKHIQTVEVLFNRLDVSLTLAQEDLPTAWMQ